MPGKNYLANAKTPSLKDLALKELNRTKHGQTKDQLMKNLHLYGNNENQFNSDQIEINRKKLTDALVVLGVPSNNFIRREFVRGEWKYFSNQE